MDRPSRERTEAARALLARAVSCTGDGGSLTLHPKGVAALRDLLAATADPSEHELAEKAVRFACAATQQEPEPRDAQDVLDEYKDPTDERTVFGWIACAYIAGARGEEPR